MKHIIIGLLLTLMSTVGWTATDFERGLEAYEAGDFKKRPFHPVALILVEGETKHEGKCAAVT